MPRKKKTKRKQRKKAVSRVEKILVLFASILFISAVISTTKDYFKSEILILILSGTFLIIYGAFRGYKKAFGRMI